MRNTYLYLNLSFTITTLLVIPPIQFVMTAGIVESGNTETGYGAIARDISTFMNNFVTAKVILHIMSQNGTFAYLAMAEEERFDMNRINAVVFDSAPVALTSKAVWNATKAAVGPDMAKRAIAFMKYIINGDYEEHLSKRSKSVLEFFQKRGPRYNVLFLYSSTDEITEPSYVKQIISICGANGRNNNVEAFDFA